MNVRDFVLVKILHLCGNDMSCYFNGYGCAVLRMAVDTDIRAGELEVHRAMRSCRGTAVRIANEFPYSEKGHQGYLGELRDLAFVYYKSMYGVHSSRPHLICFETYLFSVLRLIVPLVRHRGLSRGSLLGSQHVCLESASISDRSSLVRVCHHLNNAPVLETTPTHICKRSPDLMECCATVTLV